MGLLARWNGVYNLTAVRDPAAMRVQHLADCLAVVPPLARHSLSTRWDVRGRLLDVGSGGGLPGVVIAALLWAVVMAFLSLLPAIGAALVWFPVAIWFFFTGGIWQSIALIAWGMLVIGLVDNLLRPTLVGKGTLMPDYVVMITTLGGMVVFGINGFILGPLIAAMFVAVWHLYLTTEPVATLPTRPSDP